MSVQEVVVCATASPTAQSSGCIAFHNITTGALLASFKQTNAVKNCTAVVDTLDNQGGFLLASQPEKAVLNMYSFQKVSCDTSAWVPHY
jgi:pre-rRNA-processing protein IPI3